MRRTNRFFQVEGDDHASLHDQRLCGCGCNHDRSAHEGGRAPRCTAPPWLCVNLTDAQMRDNSLVVPVYAGPSTASVRLGNASAIVIAKSPLHVVNNFAEILFPTGATVWVEAKMLRPYHSE